MVFWKLTTTEEEKEGGGGEEEEEKKKNGHGCIIICKGHAFKRTTL
jgi:hypothetical protein